MDSAREYSFSGFTLNLHRGVLRDASGVLDLRPKTFHLLACLVENAGRVMPKEELLDIIWPDVTVTEDSLTQCIGELRRALGLAASAIRTVPRRGYVFEETALMAVPGARMAQPPGDVANGKPSIAVLPFRNLSSDPDQEFFTGGLLRDANARYNGALRSDKPFRHRRIRFTNQSELDGLDGQRGCCGRPEILRKTPR